MLRISRKILVRSLILFFLWIRWRYGYMTYTNTNQNIMTQRKDASASLSLKTHEAADEEISYAALAEAKEGEAKSTLLLLHDSGSSKRSWKHLITQSDLAQTYSIVALDRPGYGNSQSSTPESLEDRVQRIQKFVMKEDLQNIIIIWDGTASHLVLQLLSQYGSDYRWGIIMSWRFNHLIDRPSRFDEIMLSPYLSWIFPPHVRQAWVERHQAELFLKKDLEQTTKNIDTPLLVLHGWSDMVLSASHARYLASYLPEETSTIKIIKGAWHISPKKKMTELVASEIVEFAEGL